MSQLFQSTFVPTQVGQTTMGVVIEHNDDALRTKFEGASQPPSPVSSQFWSNLSTSKLQIMNQGSTTEWLNIYDFSTGSCHIAENQITEFEISGAARIGSIVKDQIIDPATCELKTISHTMSVPSLPNQLFALDANPIAQSGYGVITSFSVWQELYSTMIYIPGDAGILYIKPRVVGCKIGFWVDGDPSTETVSIAGGPTWITDDIFLDCSTYPEGWYDFVIQGYSHKVVPPPPYGGLAGIACRWGV